MDLNFNGLRTSIGINGSNVRIALSCHFFLKGIARWLEVRNLKFSSLTQVHFIQIDAKRTIYHITTLRREAVSYCTFEA